MSDTEYNPSANSNLSSHVGTDILNFSVFYDKATYLSLLFNLKD